MPKKTKPVLPLQFLTTPRRETNEVAKRRIWYAKGRLYRVVESKIPGLTTIYYAQLKGCRVASMVPIKGFPLETTTRLLVAWDNISKHRKKTTAMQACQVRARKAAGQ